MLRAIREIHPRWVVGENVFGILNWSGGLVFEQVCIDLEAEGYEVQAFVLPACGVGAPHKRDRVWFVAYAKNAERVRRDSGKPEEKSREWEQRELGAGDNGRVCGEEGVAPHGSDAGAKDMREPQNSVYAFGDVADPESERHESQQAGSAELYTQGRPRLHGGSSDGQIPGWDNFPTQSPVCGRNDGIPYRLDGITVPRWRKESIKAYGNAVCPQVVLQIFETINHMEAAGAVRK